MFVEVNRLSMRENHEKFFFFYIGMFLNWQVFQVNTCDLSAIIQFLDFRSQNKSNVSMRYRHYWCLLF